MDASHGEKDGGRSRLRISLEVVVGDCRCRKDVGNIDPGELRAVRQMRMVSTSAGRRSGREGDDVREGRGSIRRSVRGR